MILLVRHGVAVSRRTWEAQEDLRPLNRRGQRQAERLGDHLPDTDFTRVLTSPAVRCRETVRPLARARQVRLQDSRRLAEGRGPAALDLVLDLVEDIVLCTHGDVVLEVLHGLRHLGWDIPTQPPAAKGSTWVLAERRGAYLAPPV